MLEIVTETARSAVQRQARFPEERTTRHVLAS